MNGPRFLIWSIEHQMWWGPNKVGYRTRRDDAGEYSLAEAVSICRSANLTLDNTPDEAMVPLPYKVTDEQPTKE